MARHSENVWSIVLGTCSLLLLIALGGATFYLIHRVDALDRRLAAIEQAQDGLRDTLAQIKAAPIPTFPPQPAPPPEAPTAPAASIAAAPASAAPADSAPAQGGPAASEASAAPASAPVPMPPLPQTAAAINPLPPADASAAASSSDAAAPAPPAPTLPGSGYTVRVFTAPDRFSKDKLARLQKTLEGMGFEVGISADALFEPPGSSLSFHPAAKAMAQKLVGGLRSSYPKLQLEQVPVDTTPANAQRILIINLAAGSLG
ncbi:hypothetical protein MWN34_07365 [Ancylobacter sp. 6x-1]|uniref:Cell division protein n=1 Tax=Ancylobacter crimeensis TaxID=2579147 RepID=A0ABT0D9U8_9HYPH|nr:hypothetical protein [Ancylobacter crimeensis]MCK0196731.1 hypothetical protein [Ancylobacter crimeensis]